MEAAIRIGSGDVIANVAGDARGAEGRLSAGRGLSPYSGGQHLITAGIDHMVVAHRTEQVRAETGLEGCQLRNLAVLRLTVPQFFHVRVVAGVAEASLKLAGFGQHRGGEHVGVEIHAIRQNHGAIVIYRAQQPPVDEVVCRFETVEQRTDVAVARFDRASEFVELPLMARQTVSGRLYVWVLKGTLEPSPVEV